MLAERQRELTYDDYCRPPLRKVSIANLLVWSPVGSLVNMIIKAQIHHLADELELRVPNNDGGICVSLG